MPLQNRVTPFGSIVRSEQRGTFTGNRGVIHNNKKEIVRNYALKAWITCRLEYKGFRREVMTPNRWTELFFWDEATAFAAGHRPCAFCRHTDFKKFKSFWLQANTTIFNGDDESMKYIDTLLHTERMAIQRGDFKTLVPLNTLPDGTMVSFLDDAHKAYLWWQKQLYQWGEKNYTLVSNFDTGQVVNSLTPPSVVNTFRAGYIPEVNLIF